jgi:hypothetical protein
MTTSGAAVKKDFDPLNPNCIADPKYESYSQDGRCQVALELNSTRCINALMFLNKKPHQVKKVGHSFIDFGWIDISALQDVLAMPRQQVTHTQDIKNSNNSSAASVFKDRSSAADVEMDSDPMIAESSQEGGANVSDELS